MASPSLFPLPPDTAPSSWTAMVLYAATVLLEADGEPDPGRLCVAWVIRTRVLAHPRMLSDRDYEVLSAVLLAPRQFSCWSSDYAGMRTARLAGVSPRRWTEAWKAAVSAWFGLVEDPTHGAQFYLNPELTRQIRPQHDLPSWYDPTKVTAHIGRHEFLRLA